MKKFSSNEEQVLSEIYRRLNYFHGGNISESLLYLAYPSEAKKIEQYNLIRPSSTEIPRALNWYRLTEAGKRFFSKYIAPVNSNENLRLFEGGTISFDKQLLK